MVTYSTSDLSRRSGDVIADALRAPVTITQRSKARLVLLSVEHYRQLRAIADPRTAGRIEDMPDDLFAEVVAAVERYENDDR